MAAAKRIDVNLLLLDESDDKNTYLCSHCHQLLEQPVQHRCGHRYCEKCIKELISKSKTESQDILCKVCVAEKEVEAHSKICDGPESFSMDHTMRHNIEKLQMKCDNHLFGCGWQGVIKQFWAHKEHCKYKPMYCPLCGERVAENCLEVHREQECSQRKDLCCFCERIVIFSEMQAHKKSCVKGPTCHWNKSTDLPCPLGCDNNKPIPFYWRTSIATIIQDNLRFDLKLTSSAISENSLDVKLYSCGNHGSCAQVQSLLLAVRQMQNIEGACLVPSCKRNVSNIKPKPDLRIACNLNTEVEEKCAWQGSFGQYKDHMQSKHVCPFCDSELRSLAEASDHSEKCQTWQTLCLWCNQTKPFEQIHAHQSCDGDCEWQLCPFDCHRLFKRKEMKEHLRNFSSSHMLDLKGRQDRISHAIATYEARPEGEVTVGEQIQQELEQWTETLTKIDQRLRELEGGATTTGAGNRNDDELIFNVMQLIKVTNTDIKRLTQQTHDVQLLRRKTATLERLLLLKDVAIADLSTRMENIELSSTDGKMLWKVDNVHRRKEDAKMNRATSIFSPSFYTHPRGYKLCLRLYLNGDGNGRGENLSLFFALKRSPYDAFVPWPFNRIVTLKILDPSARRNHVSEMFKPDDSSSSFERPKTEMNIASGSPNFMKLAELDKFIEPNKDCLYVYAEVQQPDVADANLY